MLSVVQLSDLHVTEPGVRGYGGLAPDTGESFQAVAVEVGEGHGHDLTVVTGDICDNGSAAEYEIAAARLSQLRTPVTVLAGNHDFDGPFQARMAGTRVAINRAERHHNWLFVYLDSNFDGRHIDETGRMVDNPDRIMANGGLGPAQIGWVDEILDASDADHVWLWSHHAPAASGMFDQPSFEGEIAGLIERHPNIAGVGAGHTHTNEAPTVAGRPVHICPSLTLNFDIHDWTTLPPGYRTYRFHPDGQVDSECHLIADDRWPRLPLPEPAVQVLRGEISWSEGMAQMGFGSG